jgi:hypothetical protein
MRLSAAKSDNPQARLQKLREVLDSGAACEPNIIKVPGANVYENPWSDDIFEAMHKAAVDAGIIAPRPDGASVFKGAYKYDALNFIYFKRGLSQAACEYVQQQFDRIIQNPDLLKLLREKALELSYKILEEPEQGETPCESF